MEVTDKKDPSREQAYLKVQRWGVYGTFEERAYVNAMKRARHPAGDGVPGQFTRSDRVPTLNVKVFKHPGLRAAKSQLCPLIRLLYPEAS